MIGTYDAIIITADEPYQGMSHTQVLYTNYLAKFLPVLYVQAPKKWKPWNFLGFFFAPTNAQPGIDVVTYCNALPASLTSALAINESLNAKTALKWLRKKNIKNCVVWHFDSYRSVLNAGGITKHVQLTHLYHVIDPYYKNPVDPILRRLARAVVVTSPRNNQFYTDVTAKLLNIPQCIDLEKEQSYLLEDASTVVKERDYIVLLGTISDDCDFEMLLQIAQAGQQLLMIGKLIPLHKKQNQFDALLKHAGVTYLGFLPPHQFYPYLQRAKLGIIAYDLSIRSRSFSPLKAINYLIAGLPVLSNCETEIEALKNKVIFETAATAEFINYCTNEQVLKNKASNEVAAYLQAISLKGAIETILARL